MVGLDDHLKDPLYANWVRNIFALNIVNSVLQPYVYGEVVKLHKSIISRCPAGVTCGSCSWRRAPRCPNNFCNFIKDEIRKKHRYTDPSFDNTNASDWKSDAWEIAKCFMPKGYRECTSSSADFSATVNIVTNCKAFDALVLCNLDSPRNIFSKARKLRNDLMHSNKLKVSEYYFQSNLDLLMRILNDIKNKPTNFTEALYKITELKAGRLKITLEDVLDARTQFLLENGATKEFVNEKIANLEQEIKEGASIWKVSQHRLIDNFVEGSKYALVKIMEGHMDKVKPERCPKQKWNFSKFLDGIESDPEIILLHQRHRLKLYPDDGVTADIRDLDLFLLCHILSIESTVLLDNNLKDYIRELIRIRDQILGNSRNIAVTDLEELAECLEEPLRTEILQIYHREGIIDDALTLQFELTSWKQNEDTMENKQISNKALQEIRKQATRIDELEKKVDLLLQQNEDKTEMRRDLKGHDRCIETNVIVKPKHCDKKEKKQVQDNMISEDEAENIFLANGGRNDFCEKLHVKTGKPRKGSIILKVTCESIKDLVRFWHSCTDGSALRALSKVRDDYRKFLGCQTLDFDIILTKKEVNRCMEYLIDRLSSRISDISVSENAPGTQTLVETVPASVEAEDTSKENIHILTEESDRETRITTFGAKVSKDVLQFGKKATTSGEILKQTCVSLEEVYDVPEEIHDMPEEIHDFPDEIRDVPGARKELRVEEDRPGYSVYGAVKADVKRTEEETTEWSKIPKETSEDLKVEHISRDDESQISDTDKQEFQVSLADIGPIIDRKYEKLCDIKQKTLSLYFKDEKSSSPKTTKEKTFSSKFPSKYIRIAVQGSHNFDQIRLKKVRYADSEEVEDSSGDEKNSSLSADDEDTYSSSDSEKNEERPENTVKSDESLKGLEKNEDTLETIHSRRRQQPSNWDRYKSFLEIESGVTMNPYQLIVIEIEHVTENTPLMEILEMSLRKAFDQKTIDQDTITVVDVQYPDVEKVRQIIIDKVKEYFSTCMEIGDISEDQISVGYPNHNISKVLSFVIGKRLKLDYQELKTILEDTANDDLIYRYMIREVKYNLGISDPESKDDGSFEILQRKILKLPHVFGVGACKGILQIHTVSDEEKQTEEINGLLKGTEYENAYKIMQFKTRPKFLGIQPGNRLRTEFNGTLGCFLQDSEHKLYALTAAHIFQLENDVVYANRNTAIGNLDLNLSGLYAINRSMDFGLIEIKQGMRSGLRTRLKDDNNTPRRRWMIMNEIRDIDPEGPVYKFGSKTSLTFGKFSVDNLRFEDGHEFYTLEDKDGSDLFAKKGDSGSVVCQFNKTNKIGIAISLLTQCDPTEVKHPEQEPRRVYYSIPLKNIVNELHRSTGKTFWLA